LKAVTKPVPKVLIDNEDVSDLITRLTVTLNSGGKISTAKFRSVITAGELPKFDLDREISIYVNDILVYSGLIEKKEITRTRSQYNLFELDVSCSDHGIRLVDKLVTRVFYGQDISETVKQLLQLVPGLSPDTKYIYPSETTLDEIRFAYKTVYECLNALSKLPRVGEFSFYVDANKKLHFEPLGLEHSGLTLRPNDIVNLKRTRYTNTIMHSLSFTTM